MQVRYDIAMIIEQHFIQSPLRELAIFTRNCLKALEKGKTIACELRLAVTKMTNSHLRRLNVSLPA